jgi:phosphopentomutase
MVGEVLDQLLPEYPDEFPDALIREFESRICRSMPGNRPASGTLTAEELGAEHLKSGSPAIYLPADGEFILPLPSR